MLEAWEMTEFSRLEMPCMTLLLAVQLEYIKRNEKRQITNILLHIS